MIEIGGTNVNDIKTMEEALVTIGYIQRKFQNEYDVCEDLLEKNKILLDANVTLRKNLQNEKNISKGWKKIALGNAVLLGFTLGYIVETKIKAKKAQKELEQCNDIFEDDDFDTDVDNN